MKTLQNFDFKGQRVIMRVDFNVPLNESFEVTDDTRIREALKSIRKIVDDGGKLVLMSHLGRPKAAPNPKYSLAPVAKKLAELIGKDVIFTGKLLDADTISEVNDMKNGDLMLLENVRFYPGEEKGDKDFAAQLAALGDIYVNDAFGTAHRAHASTTIVAEFFPENKCFGYLMEHEIVNLEKVLAADEKPYTAIIGGAKVSTKIDIIKNLIGKVDNMVIGGGMVFTFVKALGGNIGNSLFEEDKVELAKETLLEMMRHGVNVILPTDVVIADQFSNEANTQITASDSIPDGWMGLDVGPESRRKIAQTIATSKTILWNGPMGVFEMDKFQAGTKSVAVAVAAATEGGAYSAIGGGDSVAAINKYNMAEMMSYVSTGGGAMLEYIEGKILPGIKAIKE